MVDRLIQEGYLLITTNDKPTIEQDPLWTVSDGTYYDQQTKRWKS